MASHPPESDAAAVTRRTPMNPLGLSAVGPSATSEHHDSTVSSGRSTESGSSRHRRCTVVEEASGVSAMVKAYNAPPQGHEFSPSQSSELPPITPKDSSSSMQPTLAEVHLHQLRRTMRSLAGMMADALNTIARPVHQFRSIIRYDDAPCIAELMEKQVCTMKPADVLEYALQLQRGCVAAISELQRYVSTMHQLQEKRRSVQHQQNHHQNQNFLRQAAGQAADAPPSSEEYCSPVQISVLEQVGFNQMDSFCSVDSVHDKLPSLSDHTHGGAAYHLPQAFDAPGHDVGSQRPQEAGADDTLKSAGVSTDGSAATPPGKSRAAITPDLVSYAGPLMTGSAAQARDEIGMKVVNQYTFLKELGRGRYGKVKLATTSGGEMVAIKIVPHSYVHQHKLARPCSASSDSAKRNDAPGETAASNASPMEREVKVMSRLRHKNILRLREVIDDPQAKNIYLVMNYAERGQLVSMRPDGSCTPLQFDVARGYMRQLLSGLQYLHNHNICHRDIKNENILLGANGVVYFSDFGVSSFFASPSERFDHCEGTPAYHAPEICRGEAFRGPPADVWALGVTFYAMLYGCLPFRGATLIELRESIMNDKLEFPPFVVPDELADDSIFSMSENMSMAAFNDAEVQSDVDENDGTFAEADSGAASREMSQELSRSMTGGKRKERRIVFPANARHRNGGTFSQHLDFQDLLTHMLEKDPERRFTIAQCRQHAFVHTTTGTAGRLRHLKQMGVIGKVEPPAVLSQFFPVVDMNELSCTQKPEDGADATERQSLSLDSAGANHPTSASSSALAQPVSQTSSPVLQMTPDTWVAPAGLSPEGSALSPVVPVEGFHGSQEASIPLSHRSVSAIPGGVGPPALSGLAKSQYHRPHETGNSDDDRFSRTAVLSRDHPHFVETQGDSGRRAHHSEGRARASSKEKGKRRR